VALGGLCGLVRLDGDPADPEAVRAMALAVPWRSGGGLALASAPGAALASLVPEAAEDPSPEAGLAAAGPLRAVVDARLVGRRELAAAIGPELLPPGRDATAAELVLGAYRRWGERCPDRLLGEFAFAVWDGEHRSLFCARDPIGARPFCYALSGSEVRIASSPLQVLAGGGLAPELDGFALLDFLAGNFRDQARTFFAGVRNLLPGHSATLGAGVPRARRYWHPEAAEIAVGNGDWVEAFRELLERAVADHLGDAGAEAAVMVSGGLDSSSVAAIAQDLHRRDRLATRPVAVTYVFERLTECDEWRYASALPEETGIEVERLAADDRSDLVPDSSWSEPVESPVALPGELTGFALERIRARGCRAVATGFGGDSLFDAARWQTFDHVRGGRLDRAWPWIVGARRRGASWPKAAAAVLGPPLLSHGGRRRIDRAFGRGRYWQAPLWLLPEHRRRAEERLASRGYRRRCRGFARQRQYEHVVGLAQQGPGIESWVTDGARHGVEARFPLLDRRLAELVLAAPLEIQARPGPGGSKWLLREAVAGVLPERIRRRTDKGSWTALRRETICRRLSGELSRLPGSSRLARLGLIDDERFHERVDRYCAPGSRPSTPSHLLASVYLLERWLRSPGVDAEDLRFEGLEPWQEEGEMV